METKFQTSFIPKTTLDPIANHAARKPLGFFSFVSSIIFFITVLVAGGAFGWHKYLDSNKLNLQASLDKNIKAFEVNTLDEYVRLNNRIDSAKMLLSKHVAMSYVFDFLQDQTIQSIKFDDFKYDLSPNGSAVLSMNGQAKGYNAVAYQAEVFSKERAIQTPLFSNLDVDTFGSVTFNFTAKVDPGFITYTRKANTDMAPAGDKIKNIPGPDVTTPNTQVLDSAALDDILNSNPSTI